ncbi:phosphoinositide 3-kinase adapter protein 1 isoform X1 [Rhopalosiphum maidis]|uniref:phosphoinositide 3-kinase adapter protein 1 isoform X1 n=2 Tax=Rhopalosiphum maidis TaxID=43146 RepID=UPI000EFDDCCB|nr:phosphoinositide 3-kinase adapter protein 1 isoform X1 [Rhopalosiphum maidis]
MDTAMDNPSYFALNQGLRRVVPVVDRQRMARNKTETGSMGRTRKTDRSGNKCLTRSFSANIEEARLLVMGQPRPADVAPSVKHRRHASTGHKDSLQHDLVHCDLQPDGDVFFSSSGDVRYSNLKSTARGGRRHSISSFGNYSSRRPLSDCMAKAPRAGDFKGMGMKSDCLDIVIVSSGDSEAAMMWINFLIQCFQHFNQKENKSQYRIQRVRLEDVLSDVMSAPRQERCSQARLQIVLVCPIFLERVLAHTGRSDCLSALLQTNRMLALLVGVTESDVTDQHKTVLIDYDKWRKMAVKDQDRESVGDFYGVSMDILSKSMHVQKAVSMPEEDTKFSITPKKIKIGQNKLIVLLSEPLVSEDNVIITVDKNGHKIEVTNVTRRNPYTLQFKMPLSCLQVSVLVNVIVEKNGQPLGQRSVKCESRMRELDQLIRSLDNPLNFLCQTFGLNPVDREQLDLFLVTAYVKNVPPNFHLLQPAGSRFQYCHEEYPTMLHFSAKHGLEKLSWHLLESPGGEQACQLRNASQMTPADVAEASNHQKLAQALRAYVQMTELTSMYSILKGISDGHHQQTVGGDDPDANYMLPRPLNDSYLVPPAPRPVAEQPAAVAHPHQPNHCYTNVGSPLTTNATMFNYQIPPPPQSIFATNYQVPTNGRPYSPAGGSWSPTHPAVPSSPVDPVPSPLGYLEMSSNSLGSANYLRANLSLNDSINNKSTGNRNDFSIPSSRGSNQMLSTPQDELLEIIHDFKNNVLTINEVENLVETWKNRNDVQQSFKEKQEQLNQMRVEYDRIQQRMKDQLKRPTPFDRIKKFFGKNKSKHSEISHENLTKRSGSENHSKRPSSSLSLQSSSSSTSCGRSSTVSTSSVNDNQTIQQDNLDDGKPLKSSFSYFDQPHSFSTFLQQGSKTTADFAGHDYGNVVYSPVGSATAETIMEEEIDMPSCNASRALGASALRCMTGIACTIATSPTTADKSEHDEAAVFEQSYSGGGGGSSVSGADFEDVEDKVQRLFDNMPDYTNVTVSDRNSRKYAPLQT